MKKWVFILLMFLLLSGCKGNQEVLTDLSEFPDNSFTVSTVEKVDCYLGGGRVYSLCDDLHIADIYDGLMSISVNSASSKKNLNIDDGDILFCFVDEDDTNHMISFLTSEYYFDGEKYYEVRESAKLQELMYKVVDYYQMEVEDGE